MVTIRPRTSGTAQTVSFRSPTSTSRIWTSTPHSDAMRVIRSWVFWESGQPTTFRPSSTPWTIKPPCVMAIAAMVSRTPAGTPRLKSSCSCSRDPKRLHNSSVASRRGMSPIRGTETIQIDYQILMPNSFVTRFFLKISESLVDRCGAAFTAEPAIQPSLPPMSRRSRPSVLKRRSANSSSPPMALTRKRSGGPHRRVSSGRRPIASAAPLEARRNV